MIEREERYREERGRKRERERERDINTVYIYSGVWGGYANGKCSARGAYVCEHVGAQSETGVAASRSDLDRHILLLLLLRVRGRETVFSLFSYVFFPQNHNFHHFALSKFEL